MLKEDVALCNASFGALDKNLAKNEIRKLKNFSPRKRKCMLSTKQRLEGAVSSFSHVDQPRRRICSRPIEADADRVK
jgi:hypothetical protein